MEYGYVTSYRRDEVLQSRVSLISLRGDLIMSRRIIISLAASVIIGIGFIGTISTDASAYYRGGVYRGGVYRGGIYRGVRPGVAVGIGPAPVGCPYGYYYYPPYNRCVPTP